MELEYEPLVQYDTPIEYNDKELSDDKLLPLTSSKPDIENILNVMIPPKKIVIDNKKNIQYVLKKYSGREDISELQKKLDDNLKKLEARNEGICKVREQLFYECFNEIIRQVTLECLERGFLLMKVRDELKVTLSSYITLYNSTINYSNKKQKESDSNKINLKNELKSERKRYKELEKLKENLILKKNSIMFKIEEDKKLRQADYSKRVENLSNQILSLKSFFKQII